MSNTTNCWAGCTPLLMATCQGHLEVVKYLIHNGADTEIPGEYWGEGPFTPYQAAKLFKDKHGSINAVYLYFENLFNEEELKKEVKKNSQINNGNQDRVFKVQIHGMEDKVVYLARNYGSKYYIVDTVVSDSEGILYFDEIFQTEGGTYHIIGPEQNYLFEFISNTENISLETWVDDPIDRMNVIQSKENEALFEYMKFIKLSNNEFKQLNFKLKNAPDVKEQESIKASMEDLTSQVNRKRLEIIKNNPDLLVSDILSSATQISIPEGNYYEKKEYFILHYWDYVDLSNENLLRTNVIQIKLEKYLSVIQDHERCIELMDTLLNKKGIHPEVREDILVRTINYLNTRNGQPEKAPYKLWTYLVLNYFGQENIKKLPNEDLSKIIIKAKELCRFAKGQQFPFDDTPELRKVKEEMTFGDSDFTFLFMHNGLNNFENSKISTDLNDIAEIGRDSDIQVVSFNWGASSKEKIESENKFIKIQVSEETGKRYEKLFISTHVFLIENDSGLIMGVLSNPFISSWDKETIQNIFSCFEQ